MLEAINAFRLPAKTPAWPTAARARSGTTRTPPPARQPRPSPSPCGSTRRARPQTAPAGSGHAVGWLRAQLSGSPSLNERHKMPATWMWCEARVNQQGGVRKQSTGKPTHAHVPRGGARSARTRLRPCRGGRVAEGGCQEVRARCEGRGGHGVEAGVCHPADKAKRMHVCRCVCAAPLGTPATAQPPHHAHLSLCQFGAHHGL